MHRYITELKKAISTAARIQKDLPGVYGENSLVKTYLDLSSFPSGVVIQHGWTPRNNILPSELENTRWLMLCLNKRYKSKWVEQSNIPCEIIGSPFVHYRRLAKIIQCVNAKGTLAFPAHSIKEIHANYDLNKYCDELNNLPSEFQPVTICLHHLDIMHYQMDEKFRERGFDVACITANKKAPPAESFYNLIKNFKYTTSNEPGSYTFYSVEMNIPFFVLGDLAIRDNTTGTNIDVPQKTYTLTDFKYGKIAYDLFSNHPRDRITKEQRDFVLSELGMLDCAPKSVLAEMLNEITLKQQGSNDGYKAFMKRIWRLVKKPQLFLEALKDIYLHNKHFR